MDTLTIQGLIESLSMFTKLYDVIRVIDPFTMEVIHDNLTDNKNTGTACYDFWHSKGRCSNCVSMKAVTQKDTFIKIENKGDKSFMITASPVQVGGKEYIFEMIKDVTNTEIITQTDGRDIKDSDKIITDLNKQVVTDDLTCLYNRRYINDQLPIEIAESVKRGKKFSLLMIDIDNFKEINDTYGHLVGDAVIQALSKIMGTNVRRDTDWIARYGGEEFLIFLKGADQKVAYRIAENIRKTIERQVIAYEEHVFPVTISVGTYTVEPGSKGFKETLQAVDGNLYKAKNQGRNRTISS